MIRSATAAACSRAEQPLSRVGQEGRALPTNGQTFCGCVGARRPFIKTMHRMCVFDNGDNRTDLFATRDGSNGDNRTDLFVRSVRSDKLSVQERCMVRHALTGNIFAIGYTRSTCNTLYGRIGDIVPAWRQSDRPFREVRQVRQVICPWRQSDRPFREVRQVRQGAITGQTFCVRRVRRGIDRSGHGTRISLCMPTAKRSVQ
jgi:hypothetical protein